MGRIFAERWGQDVFCKLVEGEMRSPIEHLFYIACAAMCEATFTAMNPDPDYKTPSEIIWPRGVYLSPQHQIGKYRVDFLLYQHRIAPEDLYTPVIVELDGHDFHDKNKAQRAYEKARDRYFVREKFRVLHFTGSEVVSDPFRVAHEALDLVGALTGTEIGEYNPLDPLGYQLEIE